MTFQIVDIHCHIFPPLAGACGFHDAATHLLHQQRAMLRKVLPFLSPQGSVVASIFNIGHASVRLSLLAGDSDEDVQRAVEEMVALIAAAMKALDLPGLTKLKMALVSQDRIIGINTGLGLDGEKNPTGDWEQLRESEPGTDEFSLSMLLEPMYLLMGRNFGKDETTYDFETCDEEEATGAIFASEALTDDTDGWSYVDFGEILFLTNDGERVTKSVNKLSV